MLSRTIRPAPSHARLACAFAATIAGSLLYDEATFARAAQPRAPSLVVDETFAPQLVDPSGGRIDAAVLREDGSAVLGGRFVFVNEQEHRYFVGLRANGSIDRKFAPDGGPDAPVTVIEPLADGRLLIAGHFRTFGGVAGPGLVRTKADGSVDDTFQPPRDLDGRIYAIAPLADGRAYVAGLFTAWGGEQRPGLVRLLSDGSLDPDFRPKLGTADRPHAVVSLSMTSGGSLLVVYAQPVSLLEPINPGTMPRLDEQRFGPRVACLTPEGRPVDGFQAQPSINFLPRRVFALPDGKFLLAGGGGLQRYFRDGEIDGGFQFAEKGKMFVADLVALTDGRLLIGGVAEEDALLTARLLVLGRDGGIATRYFMPRDEFHAFSTIKPNGAGRFIAAGRVSPSADRLSFTKNSNRVLVVDDQLREDRQFRARVGGAGRVTAAVAHPRGTVTIGGVFMSGDGLSGTGVMRLKPDGGVDNQFRPVGSLNGVPHVLVPLINDGVLAAGIMAETIAETASRPVLRFRNDGAPDHTFATDLPITGIFTDYAVMRDGSTILVGDLSGRLSRKQSFSNIVRLDAAGRVDRELARTSRTWLRPGDGRILCASGTASGHLLVGGEFSLIQGQSLSSLARIGTGGIVDPGFVAETKDFAVISSVVVLSDQRIFIDGWARATTEQPVARKFARLRPDGRRDPTFAMPDFGEAQPLLATMLQDNSVMVVLRRKSAEASRELAVERLAPDGSRLPGSDVRLGSAAYELKLVPGNDGTVYLIGDVLEINDAPRYGIARLLVRR